MTMISGKVFFGAIAAILLLSGGRPDPVPALDQSAAMDAFLDSLMGKMTMEEKVGQLNLVSVGFDVTGPIVSQQVEEKIRKGFVGGVFNTYTPVAVRRLQEMAVTQSRLKIPLLFGYDVIHGHKTIFPIPLGLSASWDMDAVRQSARIAAREASADGLNWVFSPMVDIARDPRWGRVAEGAGEDPYLGSEIARAMVAGYQGDDLALDSTVMACVKHFALYGAAEAGRDYNTVDMSERTMFEFFLPPYRAAIDAGVGSVMTSFNEINGVPATANEWLMKELLREQWSFDGLIVTDYTAVNELVAHGIGNESEVAAKTIQASVDMDMVGELFLQNLNTLVRDGKVDAAAVNASCRRVLEAKYKLGLFEDPFRYVDADKARTRITTQAARSAARDIARKSMVLLKNEGGVLPLKKTATVALVGPLARNQRDLIGNWSGAGDWKQAVSVEQGIRNVAPGVRIQYAHGANLLDDKQLIDRLNAHGGELLIDQRADEQLIREAVEAASRAEVIVAVVGESQGMSGEAASRADLSLPGRQQDLLKALEQTGKPLVVLLMNGRPLTIGWAATHADAILETWFAGTEAGHAIADILFGDYNPSGKLTMTFPQVVGQIPLYYNHKTTGRPFDGKADEKYKSRYLDVSNEPLYPFGFGLSYTTFEYGPLKLSAPELKAGEKLSVRTTVKNTGGRAGEEVVQLYVQDLVGSVTRPVKELVGFQKVLIEAGASREVEFQITEDDLKFYGIDMKYEAEPGEFNVFVGTHSAEGREASFRLVK